MLAIVFGCIKFETDHKPLETKPLHQAPARLQRMTGAKPFGIIGTKSAHIHSPSYLLLPSSPDSRTPWFPISGSLADTQGHGCRRACAGSPCGYYAHVRSWRLMSLGGCQAGIPTTCCWKGVPLVCYQTLSSL